MASGIGHRRLRPVQYKLELHTSHDIAKIPLPNPIVPTTSTRPPVLDSGKLTTLPPELTATILLHLDLNTLLTLRLINTLYKTLIDTLHPYKLLKQHAPHTLRILHRVQLSSHFPLHQLYTEFRQPLCRTCGAFGPLIFLPTLTRCCNQCLWVRARFQVAPFGCLLGPFARDLTPEELMAMMLLLKQLPTLLAFPGSYGSGPLHFGITDETIGLVSVAEAERVMVERLGPRGRFQRVISSLRAQGQEQGPGQCSIDIQHLLVGVYEVARTKWMGMGATDLPYWDAQKQMTESGIYCSPCTLQREYENRYEQGEGEQEDQQALIWDGDNPRNGSGPRGDNVAFYLGNICGHFEECELLKKGYVFGMKDGMTRGIGNGADFWINADGSVGDRE
ncbi:hypothetical protein EMCG_00416 [[Emmonsia] crescens]|uniref:F-box domain-containing protein n=1 Tax=[Emmonsia] crescens TaxID=73230 RepID=A0A0G2J0D9_9EURO|nr:hypothetical protein EMCG_00416 [Emmonsia crescens UAMH 3008]